MERVSCGKIGSGGREPRNIKVRRGKEWKEEEAAIS